MKDYKQINKTSWNQRVDYHLKSDFYDLPGFMAGNSSLKEIELDLLGDVKGKKVLHLQCHFGQDTISMARMGAEVVGVDLSDKAIDAARDLAGKCEVEARFVCCDLYDLPQHLNEAFDVVFTTYGTITWLPDLDKWANIISRYLKPDGQLVFAEFHPAVWMFDDDFNEVRYSYFNDGAIKETETGTYADTEAAIELDYVSWNHSLGEVLTELINAGISIEQFREYDYSPYDCFAGTEEFEAGKYRIAKLGNRMPMVYALSGEKR